MADDKNFTSSLGRHKQSVEDALQSLHRNNFSERLWKKDATLWKSEPGIQEEIRNRLGWLSVVEALGPKTREILDFTRSVREAGFNRVVLLGMGGSSLCPEVLRKTFGIKTGHPDLQVLDSTDPATILRVERGLDLRHTLFILASKSGTTLEVDSLYRYFSDRVRSLSGGAVGEQFVAITDPGTALETLAREQKFQKIFTNPADIGGRYSALSYFGLVPAALIGIDLPAFMERASEMARLTGPDIPVDKNPAVRLGAILGQLAREGRDKLTLIPAPAIGSFGIWIEQLVAESTGKEGKGLVPIDGEWIADPSLYGDDRVWICLNLGDSKKTESEQKIQALEQAGQPVIRIRLRDSMDLAGEFFRWEMATAAAGAVLGINPFDEPNISESKANTRVVLETFKKSGRMPSQEILLEEEKILLYGDLPPGTQSNTSLKEIFEGFLGQSRPNDYLALMAYIEYTPAHEALLQEIRHWIRDRYRIATTLGYGPRFLHSTGQLHKGGADHGLFLQITSEDSEDIPISGRHYTFGNLKMAQALGDYSSLTQRKFRLLRIHLGTDLEGDLKKLIQMAGIRR